MPKTRRKTEGLAIEDAGIYLNLLKEQALTQEKTDTYLNRI